jgi:D-alanyl-D-alanine carboxypeptidase
MRYLMFFLTIASAQASAAADCKEQIKDLVVHSNGNIYFSTNLTCPTWCQLDMGSEKQTDRAYSMLLAARVKGEELMFRWGSSIPKHLQDAGLNC